MKIKCNKCGIYFFEEIKFYQRYLYNICPNCRKRIIDLYIKRKGNIYNPPARDVLTLRFKEIISKLDLKEDNLNTNCPRSIFRYSRKRIKNRSGFSIVRINKIKGYK